MAQISPWDSQVAIIKSFDLKVFSVLDFNLDQPSPLSNSYIKKSIQILSDRDRLEYPELGSYVFYSTYHYEEIQSLTFLVYSNFISMQYQILYHGFFLVTEDTKWLLLYQKFSDEENFADIKNFEVFAFSLI